MADLIILIPVRIIRQDQFTPWMESIIRSIVASFCQGSINSQFQFTNHGTEAIVQLCLIHKFETQQQAEFVQKIEVFLGQILVEGSEVQVDIV